MLKGGILKYLQTFFESYIKTKALPPVFCYHQQILNNPPRYLHRFASSRTSPRCDVENNLVWSTSMVSKTKNGYEGDKR